MENDSIRPLSEEGNKDIHRLADWLRPMHIQVSHFLHSEKLRTQQTADIVSSAILSATPMQSDARLNPMTSLTVLLDMLYHLDDDVLWVGHLPWISRLVSLLVARDENLPVVDVHPGTMICLHRKERHTWTISWMLSRSY
jgi:phosphohistidine phosphatase